MITNWAITVSKKDGISMQSPDGVEATEDQKEAVRHILDSIHAMRDKVDPIGWIEAAQNLKQAVHDHADKATLKRYEVAMHNAEVGA